MLTKQFTSALDHGRITQAIGEAEKLTSGEIRVFISRYREDDPVRAAQYEFLRVGMDRTRQHNAVLLFVAPKSQTFAIIGDSGVHEKCGDEFWGKVAEAMRSHFVAGDFTAGILEGIESAGRLLAEHFPHLPDDVDELPNTVME